MPNGWYGGSPNPASMQMVKEYIAKYGGTPSEVNADVAEAYPSAKWLTQAVQGDPWVQQREDHRLPALRT